MASAAAARQVCLIVEFRGGAYGPMVRMRHPNRTWVTPSGSSQWQLGTS